MGNDEKRRDKKLQKLRKEKEKELLTNFEENVGKYYKANDGFAIGKIYRTTNVLECRELFFDDETYNIWCDASAKREVEEIEVISQAEFEQILDNWLNKLKKIFIKEDKQ